MNPDGSHLIVTAPGRFFGTRRIFCSLVNAAGKKQTPLDALSRSRPDHWWRQPGFRFRVTADVTPLKRGRLARVGLTTWRLRVDRWIEVTELPPTN